MIAINFVFIILGGDEWKVLADRLGLTPAVIRYIDNRTMNPMEAVLSFVTRRRYVSVGELYDLLVEQGLLAVADRL